ncbi:CDP-diacylglycerol/serine O-phosphatidyltransferase [Methanobacterium lacus]|uniref:CDP-diacylglycerol/serine O-phosphatidyltransferase n=1 Tax=Methanobacterium lacus (strain AL-21) TaxID=877455 RepID=F0T6K6_METLA|nr:archaetidylserine synthase [Methanobacterium lacus]ADZ10640.1 CDP-diacylglycerol/serine O-phosphatidyltransferase [Methanobacterium lacus]
MNIKNFMSYADLVSLANASFGFLSIVMAFKGYLDLAAQFMLIAVIFDSLDGWVARRTKRVDQYGFGENIDSLSDVISFGVAPGMLLITATSTFGIPYLNIGVALLILLCGVLRLARFNVIVNSGEVKDEKFVGLPIPTTALILGSFYLSGFFQADLAMLIMVVISLMMVSTVEYPKFRSSSVVVIGSLLIFLTLLPQNFSSIIANIPAKLLFIVSLIYLITVPFMGLYSKLRRSGPNVR